MAAAEDERRLALSIRANRDATAKRPQQSYTAPVLAPLLARRARSTSSGISSTRPRPF
jgi:hypothetical protein